MRKNRRQGESSKIQFGRKKTFLFQNFFIPTLENNYENVFYGNILYKNVIQLRTLIFMRVELVRTPEGRMNLSVYFGYYQKCFLGYTLL